MRNIYTHQLNLQVCKLVENVRAKGGKITLEPKIIDVDGEDFFLGFAKDPDGCSFELLQRDSTPQPFWQIMLCVEDLDRSISFYEKVIYCSCFFFSTINKLRVLLNLQLLILQTYIFQKKKNINQQLIYIPGTYNPNEKKKKIFYDGSLSKYGFVFRFLFSLLMGNLNREVVKKHITFNMIQLVFFLCRPWG